MPEHLIFILAASNRNGNRQIVILKSGEDALSFGPRFQDRLHFLNTAELAWRE